MLHACNPSTQKLAGRSPGLKPKYIKNPPPGIIIQTHFPSFPPPSLRLSLHHFLNQKSLRSILALPSPLIQSCSSQHAKKLPHAQTEIHTNTSGTHSALFTFKRNRVVQCLQTQALKTGIVMGTAAEKQPTENHVRTGASLHLRQACSVMRILGCSRLESEWMV